MRKMISNILTTTGITILVLSGIALCYQASYLCIDAVFQSLLVNILIHIGLFLMNKLDFTYVIMKSVLEIGYALLIVLISGVIFHWYENMPVWNLILMTIIIFGIGLLVSAFSIVNEVNSINKLLDQKNRNWSGEYGESEK